MSSSFNISSAEGGQTEKFTIENNLVVIVYKQKIFFCFQFF